VAIAPVELKTGAALALPPSSNQQREKFRAELLIGRAAILISPSPLTTQL